MAKRSHFPHTTSTGPCPGEGCRGTVTLELQAEPKDDQDCVNMNVIGFRYGGVHNHSDMTLTLP